MAAGTLRTVGRLGPAHRVRGPEGGIFNGGVANRPRENVGGGMIVDAERLDHARVGHEGAGPLAVGASRRPKRALTQF